MKSPLTGKSNVDIIYKQLSVPLFQNKVYVDVEAATHVPMADVILAQCRDTGFVFSGDFDMSQLEYDENYQNEQSNSAFFQDHLTAIIDHLNARNLLNGKVLEIGCGKGFFLDMLTERGVNITGIDPTYEGESDKIIKDYYGENYAHLEADLIILRHTLEHIPEPLEFLQMIAKANQCKGSIYIEIPTFEWIIKENAIEDVFYEHCNYFTAETARQLFHDAEIIHTFGGQYLSIIAKLENVRNVVPPMASIEEYSIQFPTKLAEYQSLLQSSKNIAIWGAGAKGAVFLNLLDRDRTLVRCVIDINSKKQGKFIGGTGHPIISPEEIGNFEIDTIVIMNKNYTEEIKKMVDSPAITFVLL